jgi:hypothetical protein
MKHYLFLLIILSSSFLGAMEREPVRTAVVAHLVDCYGSDDIQDIPAPENAYGEMDQWCTGKQTSARVCLWLASKDPVEARAVQHMSLVDLLHIAGNCSSPVPVSIAEELNNERRVILEQTLSRLAQAQQTRQAKEVVLVMGDDQAADTQFEQEEAGCCSCICFKEFIACVKKKDQ